MAMSFLMVPRGSRLFDGTSSSRGVEVWTMNSYWQSGKVCCMQFKFKIKNVKFKWKLIFLLVRWEKTVLWSIFGKMSQILKICLIILKFNICYHLLDVVNKAPWDRQFSDESSVVKGRPCLLLGSVASRPSSRSSSRSPSSVGLYSGEKSWSNCWSVDPWATSVADWWSSLLDQLYGM